MRNPLLHDALPFANGTRMNADKRGLARIFEAITLALIRENPLKSVSSAYPFFFSGRLPDELLLDSYYNPARLLTHQDRYMDLRDGTDGRGFDLGEITDLHRIGANEHE
jgi:hypothetical protein